MRNARGRPGVTALRTARRADATPALTRSEAEERFLSLVVEVDGFAYHRTRAAFERDRRRDPELQAHGLRVMLHDLAPDRARARSLHRPARRSVGAGRLGGVRQDDVSAPYGIRPVRAMRA